MRKLKNSELNRLSVDEFKEVDKYPVAIVLDNIRSLNNIGSIFRSADSFRIEKIYLCGITGTPPHREIHKTALGATESVSWTYFAQTSEIIKKLKEDGYKVIVIEQVEKSIPLEKLRLEQREKVVLVFGNEIQGVSEEIVGLADVCIEIPQFGTKHSINVAVSVGIVLWQLYIQSITE